ncbi:TetR/AcrR family transcriptional regulator [Cellulomonas sp. NS3]|uniref:TetR/AcrR family transcriptional regulator n=1 Tax=Cellulomonas sp. NS3 TaxID=2973977 RepID=UPI002163AED8|nr:TetR/AcrR family transcriptional regulator [Cellulomonas sp. NS3]
MGRSEETRERLRAVALALFVERGFDATTVNEVAAAAGVSHMTFFRHFATKEDAVLDDPYDELIVDAVLAQAPGLPVLERVRLGIDAAWSAVPEPVERETRDRVRLIAGHRGLMARAWENNRRTGDLVVEGLLMHGADPLEARVATAACLAAVMEGLLQWGGSASGGALGPVIQQSLGYLGHPRSPVEGAHPREAEEEQR